MNKIEKAVQKFLNRPESLRYEEIEKILIRLGFIKVNAKGSHRKFKHHSLNQDLIIPVHNNNCKNFYKIQAAKIVKKHIL